GQSECGGLPARILRGVQAVSDAPEDLAGGGLYGPGVASAQPSVSTALPGYLRAIRSAATWAISLHGFSTLMCGASWPAATRSASRRSPTAAGSLPSSVKREETDRCR